jgi:hypothetical protein
VNTLRDAFRAALERLAARGLLGQAAPWVHNLVRWLSEVVP